MLPFKISSEQLIVHKHKKSHKVCGFSIFLLYVYATIKVTINDILDKRSKYKSKKVVMSNYL